MTASKPWPCNRLQLPARCAFAAAVLWWLVLVLPAQATHAPQVARLLLQTSGTQINATNNQHVQFTVAMLNVSCSALPIFFDQPFADRFRGAMRQDVIGYLTNNGQMAAVGTVRSYGDNCSDILVSAGTSSL